MAELLTIARPYAEAAFGVARAEQKANPGAYAQWIAALESLSAVAQSVRLRSSIMGDGMGLGMTGFVLWLQRQGLAILTSADGRDRVVQIDPNGLSRRAPAGIRSSGVGGRRTQHRP